MTVQVLFFAQARERAGRAQALLELPEGARLGDLTARLLSEYPALQPLVPTLAVAVDGELARPDTTLHAGAEVALLPPVSGG